MELLVVLSLVSMLSVILLQGTMLLYGNYQRVLAVHARITQDRLPLAWYRSSVSGMLASLDREFVFSGNEREFSGYTLSPILMPSGTLTRVRWRLDEVGGYQVLEVLEGSSQPLVIKRWKAGRSEIQYIDSSGRAFAGWEPAAQDDLNPSLVRLEITTQGVTSDLILVALQSRTDGIPDYRDFL